MTNLFIKNMVCNRCIIVVDQIFTELGIPFTTIKLGEAVLAQELNEEQLDRLRAKLKGVGFELLDDRKKTLVEKVKNLVTLQLNQVETVPLKTNFSRYVQEQLQLDYHYLSALFSQTEGVTIEQYLILQRIERAKELLVYNEYTLSEIAYKLGYSSVQHLSTQFKKVTGLTPSHFKQIKDKKRKSLDHLF